MLKLDKLILQLFYHCVIINAVSRFPDSSMVEHTAVNRGVVGSSPTQGVKAPWSSG